MIKRAQLICTHPTKKGICDLPVTELGEVGLVVMNRHWGEKHINLIPYDWLIAQMVSDETLREKIVIALDKTG